MAHARPRRAESGVSARIEHVIPFLEQLILVDHSGPLVRAWGAAFEDQENVKCVQGDFFAHAAGAMVSPANSFGIMDGGLDLAIRNELGHKVQDLVQARILEDHHGELTVGAAVVVETGNAKWPLLIAAPTMRVPESVAQTVNAYTAFRAVLLAVRRYNAEHAERPIRTVLCPGLGTGIGGLDPTRCATQMRMALLQISGPPRIPSFAQIHAVHRALRTS
jgi:O-acetyl-ADP-ribose deacetylase (regulator of RNase III)